MHSTQFVRWIALFAAAGSGSLAAAQTVTYLDPGEFVGRLGGSIHVKFEQGDGEHFVARQWTNDQVRWLFMRSGGRQENVANAARRASSGRSIEFPLQNSGVTMVGLDLQPRIERIKGAQWAKFLKERTTAFEDHEEGDSDEGEEEVAKRVFIDPDDIQPDATVRIRRIESAKTLIRVEDPSGRPPLNSSIAQSKTGQQAEFRAMADPTSTPVGSDLPLRTYVEGDKIGHVRVRATCVATGKTIETEANRGGFVNFTITDPGVWRFEFQHVAPGGEGADWRLYTATLSFEVMKGGTNND